MTRARELDERLTLYAELSGIPNAMRSFAMAELRKAARRAEAQGQADAVLSQVIDEMAPALQDDACVRDDILILLGSVRGFCGSFNEDIARWRRANTSPLAATIVVGERLFSLMAHDGGVICVPGALSAVDAAETIERVVAAVEEVRQQSRHPAGHLLAGRRACRHSAPAAPCKQPAPATGAPANDERASTKGRCRRGAALRFSQAPVTLVALAACRKSSAPSTNGECLAPSRSRPG
jgi:hypothetical protein